jgi:hypothetical protein
MWKNGILIGEDYNALIENFNILKYVSTTGEVIIKALVEM